MNTSDFEFAPAALPPEAFNYADLMRRHGLTKAEAKRVVQRHKTEKVFLSTIYQVNLVPFCAPAPFGMGTWISMKRRDREVLGRRDELAWAMRALLPGAHGFELFPAAHRVVDTSTQFHLWTQQAEPFVANACMESMADWGGFEVRRLQGLPDPFPVVLAIKPMKDVQDWRELQAMKEQDFPGREAMMFHSKDGRHALDGWLLTFNEPGWVWPFGWSQGLTIDAGDPRLGSASQRPLQTPLKSGS